MIARRLWTPTQADFDAFARLSGDDNPIHLDADPAAHTGFGRPVSHGMLIYARLWAMLRAARPEVRIRAQSLMFPNPAYAGEALELVLTQTPDGIALLARRAGDGAECLTGLAVPG